MTRMLRPPTSVCAAVLALAAVSAPASAEPMQLGVLFGPHFYSTDNGLGDNEDDDFHTTLGSTVALGPRIGIPMAAWFIPEFEWPFAVATTRQEDVTVLWTEPRILARFSWIRGKLRPFALLGVGAPMSMSSKRGLFASDVKWDAFGGIGAAASGGRGLNFRIDVRVGVTDGYQFEDEGSPIAVEGEILVGLWYDWESKAKRAKKQPLNIEEAPPDGDRDGIVDADDACPDRAEDEDSFEDKDGCPEIDNDLDQVLDIADACPTIPESFNGFEDEDGCQDSVPSDLLEVLGTIEGLLYATGVTEVPASAAAGLDAITAVMTKYPSVRVIVNGHTDDREAEIEEIEDEPPEERAVRVSDALVALSVRRAEAVRQALIDRGVASTRVLVSGKGDSEPVSENDTARNRGRNRRAEVRFYVPERPGR